jgi:hypothetical protein
LHIANANREGNQQGTPRPNTPADAAISGTEQGSSETEMEPGDTPAEHAGRCRDKRN